MTHWAAQYIGTPYRRGANGPDAYDCLAFAALIQRERFDTPMAVADVLGTDWADSAKVLSYLQCHEERTKWVKVDNPQEGDLVLMAFTRIPVHIGVWINANSGAGVLHCAEKIGVVYQTLSSLKRVGWGSFTFYRRACC